MMHFEEWLEKKQKMNMNWFLTMTPDKSAYYREYDRYRCKAARFEAMAAKEDCERIAKEILALG